MVQPAFGDPVFSAQSTFRAVLDALSQPGEVKALRFDREVPLPLTPAMAAIALALLDQDTPVWLDMPLAVAPEVGAWIRFHTGAPITVSPEQSAFAFVREQMRLPRFNAFNLGTAEYPDRSTTVVVHVDSWTSVPALHLSGPGVKGQRRLTAGPLPADMAERLNANRALFPRGVDLLLVAEDSLAALPRSVRPMIYEA
jgi:alpha-D-ribose 1-methylphosphonate 5-triphosphate synthase subunit PhnH